MSIVLTLLASSCAASGTSFSSSSAETDVERRRRDVDALERAAAVGDAVDEAARPLGYRNTLDAWPPPAATTPSPPPTPITQRFGINAALEYLGRGCSALASGVCDVVAFVVRSVLGLANAAAQGCAAAGRAVWSTVVEPALGVVAVPIEAAATVLHAVWQALGSGLAWSCDALCALGRGIGRVIVTGGEGISTAAAALFHVVESAAVFAARGIAAASTALWDRALYPLGHGVWCVLGALGRGLMAAFDGAVWGATSLWSGVCWVCGRVAAGLHWLLVAHFLEPLANGVSTYVLLPAAYCLVIAVRATHTFGEWIEVQTINFFVYRLHRVVDAAHGVSEVLRQIGSAVRVGLVEPIGALVSVSIEIIATLLFAAMQALERGLALTCDALSYVAYTVQTLSDAVEAEIGRRVLLLRDLLVGPIDHVLWLDVVFDAAHLGCSQLASHAAHGFNVTFHAVQSAANSVAECMVRPLVAVFDAVSEPLLFAGRVMVRSTAHAGRCCVAAVVRDVYPYCCDVASRVLVAPVLSVTRQSCDAANAAVSGVSRFVLHAVDVVVVAPAEALWTHFLSPSLLSFVDWLRPADPLWTGGKGGPAMTRAVTRDGVQLYVLREDSELTRPLFVPARSIHLPQEGESDSSPTVSLDSHRGANGNSHTYQSVQHAVRADAPVRLQLQSVFLPLNETAGGGGDADRPVDFAMETYSRDVIDGDSRRVFLLATPQGTTSVRETSALTRLFPVDGKGHRRWLEGTRSTQAVGRPQNESAQEEASARAKGRAVARRDFGPAFLGPKRFNAQLLVEIPTESDALADSLPQADDMHRGYRRWFSEWLQVALAVLVLGAVVRPVVRVLWRVFARQREQMRGVAVLTIEALTAFAADVRAPLRDRMPALPPPAEEAKDQSDANDTDTGSGGPGPALSWCWCCCCCCCCVGVLALLLVLLGFSGGGHMEASMVLPSEAAARATAHHHRLEQGQMLHGRRADELAESAPATAPTSAPVAAARRQVLPRRARRQVAMKAEGALASADDEMAERWRPAIPEMPTSRRVEPRAPERELPTPTTQSSTSASSTPSDTSAVSADAAVTPSDTAAAADASDEDANAALSTAARPRVAQAGPVVSVQNAAELSIRQSRVHRVAQQPHDDAPNAHAHAVPLPQGAATSRGALIASGVAGAALLGASSPACLAAVAAVAIVGFLPASASRTPVILPPPPPTLAAVPAAARPLFLHRHAGAIGAAAPRSPLRGNASAARISYGSPTSTHEAPTDYDGRRAWRAETSQRAATMTITLFFGVEGGVPSASDVERAVDELRSIKRKAVSESIDAPTPDFDDDFAFQSNAAPGWNRRRVDTLAACVAAVVSGVLGLHHLGAGRRFFSGSASDGSAAA